MTDDARLFAPAFQRNAAPITAALKRRLPERGLVLEVASGSGEHVTAFAAAFPHLTFQPSDASPEARASIDAWRMATGAANVRPALTLDAASADWPLDRADAVLCINMIHIAPWAATPGLMAGAGRLLAPGAPLVLYGPFRRADAPTAASNEAFDADLRLRDPEWGMRELEAVADEAARCGFGQPLVETLPANNLMVVFSKV